MKTISKILLIFVLVLLTSLGCKKFSYYTIDEHYLLKNNTDDTLKIISAQKIYIYTEHGIVLDTFNDNFILFKQQYERIFHPSKYYYFNIRYKNIDIKFSPDTVVNYKDNFFNLHDWQKTHKIDFIEDEYGTKELNAVFINYIFSLDTLKIIDTNEK